MIRLMVFLMSVGHLSLGCAASVFVLDETVAIKATLSNRDFNRIRVKNDRITQLFFEPSHFQVALDEKNGQIFIKPLIKTSKHPLSLSLTTEKGHTQDWLFSLKDRPANTLLLKIRESKRASSKKENTQAINFIRRLMKEKINSPQKKAKRLYAPRGLQLTQKRLIQDKDLVGYVLSLKNITKHTKLIEVNELWQNSVLAMSIQNQKLTPKASTTLWVVTDARGLT